MHHQSSPRTIDESLAVTTVSKHAGVSRFAITKIVHHNR
jgi:hypothetical protein